MSFHLEGTQKMRDQITQIGVRHEREIQKLVDGLVSDLGETFFLSEQESANISEFVFDRLKHDIPIYLGVGLTAVGTERSLQEPNDG